MDLIDQEERNVSVDCLKLLLCHLKNLGSCSSDIFRRPRSSFCGHQLDLGLNLCLARSVGDEVNVGSDPGVVAFVLCELFFPLDDLAAVCCDEEDATGGHKEGARCVVFRQQR